MNEFEPGDTPDQGPGPEASPTVTVLAVRLTDEDWRRVLERAKADNRVTLGYAIDLLYAKAEAAGVTLAVMIDPNSET